MTLRWAERLVEPIRKLHATLGAAGLTIGAISLLSFAFGLIVWARESDPLRDIGRAALRDVFAEWVRSATVNDYSGLNLTLVDHAVRWREAPADEKAARWETVKRGLDQLGYELDFQGSRFPLVRPVSLELVARGGGPVLAKWPPGPGVKLLGPGRDVDLDPVPLSVDATDSGLDLLVRCRPDEAVERQAQALEDSRRRLLLAVLGLSGYSVLCLGYMILQTQTLQERVARESAREATLDLADRTCHELGNVVFVLGNERRNLADHLDLVERYLDQESESRASAMKRAGIEPTPAARFDQALRRELSRRGLDPEVELRGSVTIARDVSRQIEVCSQYVALTVRELDTYLKQSTLPPEPAPLAIESCFDDAIALLGPRLDAAGARVERSHEGPPPVALADRRLLVHALVNLLKNAVEASVSAGKTPVIHLSTRVEGSGLTIEVADEGPGILSADLPKIFEHGFTTKAPGRGRGLAIVRESVEAQGGRIEVESRLGSGTTFRIRLDRAE